MLSAPPAAVRGGAPAGVAGASLSSSTPAAAAAAIASTWVSGVRQNNMPMAVTTASVARGRSGVRLPAMPYTANATTATATTLSPRSQPPAASSPNAAMPYPNRISSAADGRVKPSHAATPPPMPARVMPTAMPTWLLAGPGRNWHSATRSA